MKRTQLYLDEAQRKILDRLSRKTGKSVGQLVREAVTEVYCANRPLERPIGEDNPIWAFVGSGRSREGDVSVRHDHYLYGRNDEDFR